MALALASASGNSVQRRTHQSWRGCIRIDRPSHLPTTSHPPSSAVCRPGAVLSRTLSRAPSPSLKQAALLTCST
jgi:hypothetical protein